MKHKGSIHVHTLKKLQIQEVEKKSLYSCQIVDSMFIFPESYSLPNPFPVIYTCYMHIPNTRHTFQSFLIPCIIKPFGGCIALLGLCILPVLVPLPLCWLSVLAI